MGKILMAGVGMKMDARQFFRMTDRALSQMANTKVLAAGVGEMLVSSTRERFKREEGPQGKKWKKSLRAELEGGKTLTDKARLRNSIGYEASSQTVAVGTNDIRAAIHQFGGEIKPKNKKALKFNLADGTGRTVKKVTMPKRPFIGFSAEDISEAKAMTRLFIAKGFSGR